MSVERGCREAWYAVGISERGVYEKIWIWKFQGEIKFEVTEVRSIAQSCLPAYYMLKQGSEHPSLIESEALFSADISGVNPDLSKKGFARFGVELKQMS